MVTTSDALASLKSNFFTAVESHLSPAVIEQAFAGQFQRKRLFYDHYLLYPFLLQVINRWSCQQTLLEAIGKGLLPLDIGKHNAGYCNARLALPEAPLQTLLEHAARTITAAAPELAAGRRIKVVDGTTVRLADTALNQAEYPQNGSQLQGEGSPLLYILALLSLESGAVLKLAFCSPRGNDARRFAKLWNALEPGDIVLGDEAFESYRNLAALQQRQADGIFPMHQRVCDPALAQELGPGDYRVRIKRPSARPTDLDATSDGPAEIAVRFIRYTVRRKGFRDEVRWLVTTLLNAERYPAAWVAALYQRRWEMELRLRDIKKTMGMNRLDVRSPAMARKTVWMYMLAYNLVRAMMLDASAEAKIPVGRLSFTVTWACLRQWPLGRQGFGPDRELYRHWLTCIAALRLPTRDRPGEPRILRRRPKKYAQRHGTWADAQTQYREKQAAKESVEYNPFRHSEKDANPTPAA